ncbi:MAG: Maf family protein [Christensenellales bacterium]
MTQSVLPLILASGSPRRRELLDLMGLAYTVETPDVDEVFLEAGRNGDGNFPPESGCCCRTTR